jgi:HlyD family secretion protein
MQSTSKNKWIWLAFLIILAAAGVGAYYWKAGSSQEEIEFRLAQVTRGRIIQVVTATGQLNPVVNIQVGSQISGIIKNLYADYNSVVTQGQLIAEIDPATYEANVKQNEGQLANAKAALELAEFEAKRAEELFKNSLISQSDYDRAIVSLHQAQAAVKIQEANLERSKVDLARCKIYAPTNGIVIARNVDVGQTVAASFSAPTLFQIANDLTRMQINANVSEADIGLVEVGQTVYFTVDAYPDRVFKGKVIQVRNSPITVQNVVTYDTVIEVDNSELKLKPGMTANLSIVVAERQNVLKIPASALRFRPPESDNMQARFLRAMTNQTTLPAGTTNLPSSQKRQQENQNLADSGIQGQPVTGQGDRMRQGRNPMRPQGQNFRASQNRGSDELFEFLPIKPSKPVRTIYTISGASSTTVKTKTDKLKPVQVRLGISDGSEFEVIDGLNENDFVVIGMVTQNSQGTSGPQRQSNPFVPGRRF